MGVRKFEDLIAWQLSHELKEEVFALCATRPASIDHGFCDQIRDSARSAPRNIAEGFGRYRHKEFAQFLSISRGSVFELVDLLRDGVSRQYWSQDRVADLDGLCNRTISALTHLIRYLRTHPDV